MAIRGSPTTWTENSKGVVKGELDGPGRTWFRDGSLQSIWRAANGKIVANIEWREDGTLEKEEGDVQSLLGGKTLEVIRKDNRRP